MTRVFHGVLYLDRIKERKIYENKTYIDLMFRYIGKKSESSTAKSDMFISLNSETQGYKMGASKGYARLIVQQPIPEGMFAGFTSVGTLHFDKLNQEQIYTSEKGSAVFLEIVVHQEKNAHGNDIEIFQRPNYKKKNLSPKDVKARNFIGSGVLLGPYKSIDQKKENESDEDKPKGNGKSFFARLLGY